MSRQRNRSDHSGSLHLAPVFYPSTAALFVPSTIIKLLEVTSAAHTDIDEDDFVDSGDMFRVTRVLAAGTATGKGIVVDGEPVEVSRKGQGNVEFVRRKTIFKNVAIKLEVSIVTFDGKTSSRAVVGAETGGVPDRSADSLAWSLLPSSISPGRYNSPHSPPFLTFNSNHSQRDSTTRVCLMFQQRVQPRIPSHLSKEFSVSEDLYNAFKNERVGSRPIHLPYLPLKAFATSVESASETEARKVKGGNWLKGCFHACILVSLGYTAN